MLSEEEIKKGKELLEEYYAKTAIAERLPVADKCDALELIAEKLVDYITDIIYNE